jgi:hypothetical protein
LSYARFSGDSDVYVFASRTGIECCGCVLQKREWVDDPDRVLFKGYFKAIGEIVPHVFSSNQEMIEHLNIHIATGHLVPDYCLERLRDPEDEKENQEMWEKYRDEDG